MDFDDSADAIGGRSNRLGPEAQADIHDRLRKINAQSPKAIE